MMKRKIVRIDASCAAGPWSSDAPSSTRPARIATNWRRSSAGTAWPGITVVHMEVPCCHGLHRLVASATAEAGIDVPIREVIVGLDGTCSP